MGWLQDHLDNFVIPAVYRDVSSVENIMDLIEYYQRPSYFTVHELTVMKNVWRSMKRHASGKRILLAGRDVWLFEVLARRENYPTLFRPDCSRATVHKTAIEERFKDVCLLDTGFIGTIPRVLNVSDYKLLSHAYRNKDTQIFPRLTGSRALALRIEKTPKYWKTATVAEGEITQRFAPAFEIIQAAALTIEVYKSSAPKFSTDKRPLRYDRITNKTW